MPIAQSVRDLTISLVDQIAALIDRDAKARINAALDRMYNGASGRSPGREAKAGKPRAERRSLSPAVKRARKVQGQYLGALRSLTGRNRNKVKAIAKKEGVAKAVAAARALAKKA